MTTSSLSLEIISLGYMDNANWISNSKENLEDILSIADKFYGFIRAAINKNKSQLITNSSGCFTPVPLKFGTSILNLPPEKSSIHFLRVWININNSSTFVKHQYIDTIRSFTTVLKKKSSTNKQICYITNMVLFSLLEYRLQTTPLSKNECIRISSPIRILIKNNSPFSISAPNCLFTGNIFY
ncbi:8792_t:CDS:1 [Funneliformis geosporum]|nr:8792_t:CDS:1 [Funneliformis geosporum]